MIPRHAKWDSAIGERGEHAKMLWSMMLVIMSYFYHSWLTSTFCFWQKYKNEVAYLKELHSSRKAAGKHGLLKIDHDRLDYCRVQLMELTHRHQLAMQRYKEIATPIRYSFASDSNLKKIRRDRMEIMRAYTITKCRDDLQYHAWQCASSSQKVIVLA